MLLGVLRLIGLFLNIRMMRAVGVGGWGTGGELCWCFRASTNDYDDDHDGTRMTRIKRINTDDVSLEKSSTKLNREI